MWVHIIVSTQYVWRALEVLTLVCDFFPPSFASQVQAACGPQRKIKVFAEADDISLEYCDEPEADNDCNLTIDGRPVRHIRLDCRVALIDEHRAREFVPLPTKKLDQLSIQEQAPWFL
jgi:hypothetical protein